MAVSRLSLLLTAAALLTVLMTLVAACGAAEELPPLRLEPALGDATFDRPVEVGAWPDGGVFVAERGGAVWLSTGGERSRLADFAPLVEAERGEGLLSVALDPSFASSGWLWAYYFAADEPWRTVLARFEVRDGAVDLEDGLVVLELEQPGFNQNGGAIRFDPEGYLYLSVGDGSASTDPFDQGQDPSTLLAAVLRLDVREATEAEPYRVPPSNPFVESPPSAEYRPEIFAWGFRNPWRMSIDQETGEVWLGDVGFTNAEEVDRVEAGGNYGWSILEGTRCLGGPCDPGDGFSAPVYEYAHDEGRCAVVGGVVYRGAVIGALRGRYLFGDLCSGEIWALPGEIRDLRDIDGSPPDEIEPVLLADLQGMLVTFGEDADGEILVADHDGGGVYRLVPE